jgi:hypothetical protein
MTTQKRKDKALVNSVLINQIAVKRQEINRIMQLLNVAEKELAEAVDALDKFNNLKLQALRSNICQ